MSTISLKMSEYQAIVKGREDADRRLVELTLELAAAQRADPSGRIPPLLDMINHAKRLIQFAVANLPPETTRGWPYGDLASFARALAASAPKDGADAELAHSWLSWIRDAVPVEAERAQLDAAKLAVASRLDEPAPGEPTA